MVDAAIADDGAPPSPFGRSFGRAKGRRANGRRASGRRASGRRKFSDYGKNSFFS